MTFEEQLDQLLCVMEISDTENTECRDRRFGICTIIVVLPGKFGCHTGYSPSNDQRRVNHFSACLKIRNIHGSKGVFIRALEHQVTLLL
jgi:hypothetical protein